MSKEDREFESWEEVINNFFEQKKVMDELKHLKDEIKLINAQYSQVSYFNNEELSDFFDAKKNKKSKEQTDLEFQRGKALKIVRLRQKPERIDFVESIKKYRLKFQKISEKYKPEIWLSESSKNASSVSFATHVSKLTHSKIDSPSLYDQIDVKSFSVLTTSCLNNKIIDGAVSGNQFAPIFQFI
jgi:CRISPR-associated protein Csy1